MPGVAPGYMGGYAGGDPGNPGVAPVAPPDIPVKELPQFTQNKVPGVFAAPHRGQMVLLAIPSPSERWNEARQKRISQAMEA
jgi:hypothetical protein